jgi:cysteine-rich repeat protein
LRDCGDGGVDAGEECDFDAKDKVGECGLDCRFPCFRRSRADGVQRVDGACVAFFEDSNVNFTFARDRCVDVGGSLAIPGGRALAGVTNADLTAFLASPELAWLGLKRDPLVARDRPESFVALDGSPVDNPQFFDGVDPAPLKDCVAVDSVGVWRALSCTDDVVDRYLCARATCGDGLLDREQNEECDDGNDVDDDGCDADCTLPCGNGTGATRAALGDNDRCFFGFDASTSVDDAELLCGALGGGLGVPTSDDELLPMFIAAGQEPAWVGASDQLEEGSFRRLDDDGAVDDALFLAGEPEVAGAHAVANCLELKSPAPFVLGWSDISCGESRRVVCEVP